MRFILSVIFGVFGPDADVPTEYTCMLAVVTGRLDQELDLGVKIAQKIAELMREQECAYKTKGKKYRFRLISHSLVHLR